MNPRNESRESQSNHPRPTLHLRHPHYLRRALHSLRSGPIVKKPFLLRIDDAILRALRARAKVDGISVNTLIFQVLRDYLKGLR